MDEFPGDSLIQTELGYDPLCEFLHLTHSADKVRSVVTPDEREFTTSGNKASESGSERICSQIPK